VVTRDTQTHEVFNVVTARDYAEEAGQVMTGFRLTKGGLIDRSAR
jgi:hypothetical protein